MVQKLQLFWKRYGWFGYFPVLFFRILRRFATVHVTIYGEFEFDDPPFAGGHEVRYLSREQVWHLLETDFFRWSSRELIEKRLLAGNDCFVVLSDDGARCGYLWVEYDVSEDSDIHQILNLAGNEAVLIDGFVEPNHRGRGMNADLVRGTVSHLRQDRGIEHVYCAVEVQNRPSRRGLAKVGFKPLIRVAYIRVGVREWQRCKELQEVSDRGPFLRQLCERGYVKSK
jgi:ribosomal protein S18 acetylase RimI-like enzyme